MSLFQLGNFTLSSGLQSVWKIDCDALTDDDWQCLAWLVAKRLMIQFGQVLGVPRGGLKLAEALVPYATEGPLLIVDDVLTTGRSMEIFKKDWPDCIGVVVFARERCPSWVTPLFWLNPLKRVDEVITEMWVE